MWITPNRGKRIFASLMILSGLGSSLGILMDDMRSRTRTAVAEATILTQQRTGSGFGPLRQYSINTKYEFFVEGVRFEKQQLVDTLPAGTIYVRYDPRQPHNNALDLANSNPRFSAIFAGLLLVAGVMLAWHTWRPLQFLRTTG